MVDVGKILSSQQKRNQMKFTAAGYPVHDYIKEMREEREMTEYKKAMQVVHDEDEGQAAAQAAQRQAHLKIEKKKLP